MKLEKIIQKGDAIFKESNVMNWYGEYKLICWSEWTPKGNIKIFSLIKRNENSFPESYKNRILEITSSQLLERFLRYTLRQAIENNVVIGILIPIFRDEYIIGRLISIRDRNLIDYLRKYFILDSENILRFMKAYSEIDEDILDDFLQILNCNKNKLIKVLKEIDSGKIDDDFADFIVNNLNKSLLGDKPVIVPLYYALLYIGVKEDHYMKLYTVYQELSDLYIDPYTLQEAFKFDKKLSKIFTVIAFFHTMKKYLEPRRIEIR